jgi:hypothetical protein
MSSKEHFGWEYLSLTSLLMARPLTGTSSMTGMRVYQSWW